MYISPKNTYLFTYTYLCALCLKRASILRKRMVFQPKMFGKMSLTGQVDRESI